MKQYRVLYNAYYNYHADHQKTDDVWTVEEYKTLSFFGLFEIITYWSEHKEPAYESTEVIRFGSAKKAFAYVERLIAGNPRGKIIQTVVTEVDHERIN